MNERDEIRLLDMIDAAEKAIHFIAGRTREDFDSDEMLAFAVVRAVEIVGEAANHVSQLTRDSLPQIPWGAIVGMRNRIVHNYVSVDYNIVWDVVTNDLPPLIADLKKIVPLNKDNSDASSSE